MSKSKAEELVKKAQDVLVYYLNSHGCGAHNEVGELLRLYAGEKSRFYQSFIGLSEPSGDISRQNKAIVAEGASLLRSFIRFVENGLLISSSLEQQWKAEVANDYLNQASQILQKDMHAGAACMIIGATLEEFLRNWCIDKNLELDSKEPTLEHFKNALKKASLITEGEKREIEFWINLRNSAAHGNWPEVEDKNKIGRMLLGVDEFIKKHS